MFNEEAGAERCVRTVMDVLREASLDAHVIISDDGSTDGTGTILKRLAEEFGSLVLVRSESNGGYGAALRRGSARACALGSEYVLFMDSDLTNDPRDIAAFEAKMRAGYDVIKATRYGPGGGVVGVPAWRVLVSRVGNAVAERLFGVPLTDCTNGFRAIRVGLLQRMPLKENKFWVIMEELYYARKMTRSFCEIPVTLTNRRPEQRVTSFIYRPHVFWNYLKYPLMGWLGI